MKNQLNTAILRMSKRVIYSLLAFNFFLALFLRYKGSIGIANGTPDSWDYYLQINQIVKEGQISWIFHPLSYYGMYEPYMEVGIEECLHIEFEFNQNSFHLKDVILGKVNFNLVRIKI